MKKMMMVFVVLFAMVGSSFGGVWCNNAKVDDVRWYVNAAGFITIDEATRVAYNLPTRHLYVDGTEASRVLSLGLSALNSGNNVDVYVDNVNLSDGHAKLLGIVVKK